MSLKDSLKVMTKILHTIDLKWELEYWLNKGCREEASNIGEDRHKVSSTITLPGKVPLCRD